MSWSSMRSCLLITTSLTASLAFARPSLQARASDQSGSSAIASADTGEIDQSWCQQVLRQTAPHYRQLFRHLVNPKGLKANLPVFDLLRLKDQDCNSAENQQKVRRALSMHSKRIGVLLPKAPHPQHSFTSHAIQAFQQYYQSQQRNYQQHLIIMNTDGQAKLFLQRLAESVFQHQVGILIGGATRFEAALLEEWSELLQIPAIILFQNTKLSSTPKHSFYVSPDIPQMVQAMLQYFREQRIRRLAILMPANRYDLMVEHLNQRLQHIPAIQHNIYHYRHQDYNSMESSARRIFRIDAPERQEELAKLIEERKQIIEQQGLVFDPRTFMLPAIVDYDAIFIADNFKSVRHMISIFKFLNAPKVPLIGNQQWRAPELLTPPESYLEGAVFFDYIGSYRHLLPSVQVPLIDSDYFTSPEHTSSVDIKIMATYAIDLSEKVLANQQIRRYEMFQALKKMENKDSQFFAQGLVFNPHQGTFWPTFLFRLWQNRLELLKPIHDPRLSSTSLNK